MGSSTSPTIHVIDMKPDESKGVVKLVRHTNSQSARVSSDTILVTVNYEELCTLPCGVAVDNSERPIFFLMRDGQGVSPGFRIPSGGEVFTVKFRPPRKGMAITGIVLTWFLILPAGIPLWLAGRSKLWIASGDPSAASDFVRLQRARI